MYSTFNTEPKTTNQNKKKQREGTYTIYWLENTHETWNNNFLPLAFFSRKRGCRFRV